MSTCDVFNCLFPLDVQNEIQLLSGVLCYSWLVCLLGFWLRNTSLVKVGNPISDGIVFVFTLRHRRNTFCDVTAPGQRYFSLFDRMKEIASFAASPLARVYETLRPCLLWNFTSSLRLSETSFL